MYYSNDVISYLQANKILALKLDHALAGVRTAVSNQLEIIGAGAKRALYYTSCFTDEYQDVCLQQKSEDIRFRDAVFYLLKNRSIVYDMLQIYFEEIFKHKKPEQLEHIKKMLMAVNIHIAASSLTNVGFVLAVTACVCVGMNLSHKISALAGRSGGAAIMAASAYGVVQKAADSANRLLVAYPAYYNALYQQKLEMMFFLIEPLFQHAGAYEAQQESDRGIANIITKMIH